MSVTVYLGQVATHKWCVDAGKGCFKIATLLLGCVAPVIDAEGMLVVLPVAVSWVMGKCPTGATPAGQPIAAGLVFWAM